ncbi:MAG: ATP-binding cassette domain-containing protein [Proteobacteria bacterium]|jgi:ABC-2 type transport system ATP-binding protein|nr:ATP-binding cassette domain-containing protein [Pseudomonadota bacterium]
MISVHQLTRKYGKKVAVDNVTAEIEKGQIVGLLGHNGAGKTTIMKVLTGFLEPTSGTATIGGIDVVRDRIKVQTQIGYLPENAPLYPEMLVQEYLFTMARLRGIESHQLISAVADAARATGLQGHLVMPIAHLSKGYRQRVGIAQAILHKPPVLILDEPTNGLDPTQIQTIRDLIRDLGRDSTIILSTHILQEIEAVCDRVMVLIEGKLAADAPLQELISSDDIAFSVDRDGEEVAKAISAISGVTKVEAAGPDPKQKGFFLWTIGVKEGTPIPQIVALANERKWTIGSIAQKQRSLQAVFHELQQQHVEVAS